MLLYYSICIRQDTSIAEKNLSGSISVVGRNRTIVGKNFSLIENNGNFFETVSSEEYAKHK